jgi:hypothetical protein
MALKAANKNDSLDDTIAKLMVIAEGDDEEEARKARKLLAAHFGEGAAKPKARAATRASLRLVSPAPSPPASPPTAAELEAVRESHFRAAHDALPFEQRQALAKIDSSRFDAGATRAGVEGTSLVLGYSSPEIAVRRMQEMREAGTAPGGRETSFERVSNTQFRAVPLAGRR